MANKKTMSSTEARTIRKSPLTDLIAAKLMSDGSISDALKASIDDKIKGHAKGVTEKFNILFIAKMLTGNKIPTKVLAKTLGINLKDLDSERKKKKAKPVSVSSAAIPALKSDATEERKKAKRIKEGEEDTKTVQKALKTKVVSGRRSTLRKGDSIADVAAKLYNLIERSIEENKLQQELDEDFYEQRKMDAERHHKEIIRALKSLVSATMKDDTKELKAIAQELEPNPIQDLIRDGLLAISAGIGSIISYVKGLFKKPKLGNLPGPTKKPPRKVGSVQGEKPTKKGPGTKKPTLRKDASGRFRDSSGRFVKAPPEPPKTATRIRLPNVPKFGATAATKGLGVAGAAALVYNLYKSAKDEQEREKAREQIMEYTIKSGDTSYLIEWWKNWKRLDDMARFSSGSEEHSDFASAQIDSTANIKAREEFAKDRVKFELNKYFKENPGTKDQFIQHEQERNKIEQEGNDRLAAAALSGTLISDLPALKSIGQFLNTKSKENDSLFAPQPSTSSSPVINNQTNVIGSSDVVADSIPAKCTNDEVTRKRSVVGALRPC